MWYCVFKPRTYHTLCVSVRRCCFRCLGVLVDRFAEQWRFVVYIFPGVWMVSKRTGNVSCGTLTHRMLENLFHAVSQVIDYYLDTLIFPETMEHRGLKLAANGQDVGGDMLFELKLGFSGTPSDLLPLELGR